MCLPLVLTVLCTVTCCAQFITVFLVSFIAGSVLNQATSFIHDPFSIISTLGTSAPLTSIFFLTYIELNVRCSSPLPPHAPVVVNRQVLRPFLTAQLPP